MSHRHSQAAAALDTPHAEASLYQKPHPRHRGEFAVLRLAGPGRRQIAKQEMHPVEDLAAVVVDLSGQPDTYISQGTFRFPRRWVANLARIQLHFVDLDTYRAPALEGLGPEAQAERLLDHCGRESIPEPSLILDSGRGLYAKWVTSGPLPAAALPRWNEVQETLCTALAPFGADTAARDAARVLRAVGTINSKTGTGVRVLHATPGGGAYQWDAFADAILPVERRVLEETRRRRRGQGVQLSLLPGDGELSHDATKNFRRLAWNRWLDISTLIDLRGGIPEGQRMVTLFWAVNFLLASGHMSASQMWGEACTVARRIDPQWSASKNELGTLYGKAKAQAKGQMIERGGRLYPPLYTPRNPTLIEQLRITSTEMPHMTTILDTEHQAAKRLAGWRDKDQRKRRAEGGTDRATYLTRAHEARDHDLRAEIARLAAQGLSKSGIARQVGVSRQRVQQILAG